MDWKNITKQALVNSGLTQVELAKLAGCSQSGLGDLLSGRTQEPRYSLGLRLLELSNGGVPARQHIARKPRNKRQAEEV